MNNNKIIEILKWFDNYNNNQIIINYNKDKFKIDIENKILPHLLGLHYGKIKDKNDNLLIGKRLFNYFLKNNISDEEFYNQIPLEKLENIKNRINTFKEFMENLEKGIVVEKTLESKMNVNYLIIQNKDNEYYHLGIYKGESGSILDTFGKMKDNDILKTYFVENNQDYFQNSKTNEKIISIERYDEQLEMYVPFSFDEEKNQKLLMEFHQKLEEEKTIENEEDLEIGI